MPWVSLGNQARDIIPGAANNLWSGTNTGTLVWFEPSDNRYHLSPGGPTLDQALGEDDNARSLLKDYLGVNPEAQGSAVDNPPLYREGQFGPYNQVKDPFSPEMQSELNRIARIVMPTDDSWGSVIGGLVKDVGPFLGLSLGLGTLMGGGLGSLFGGPTFAGEGLPWTSGYDLAGGGSLGGATAGGNVSFFEDILGSDWAQGLADSFTPGNLGDFVPTDLGNFQYADFSNPSLFSNDLVNDYDFFNPTQRSLFQDAVDAKGLLPELQQQLNKNYFDMLSKAKDLATSTGNRGPLDKLAQALGLDPDGILGSGLNLLGSTGPALAAINYARNLGGPDTSLLESAYNRISPESLALPYDIQTGKGREALTSSLTSRGIMGSSFANQDLSSFDTLRELGRQNLLTQGVGQQADIASRILTAKELANKNKLDLYGRSLLALSGGLSPAKNSSFWGY